MRRDQLAALMTPKLPEGDIIITTVSLGGASLLGLGDHLIYSTLAARFKALGRNVYLDKDCRASNPEIMELVWGHNSDITDATDRKPNAGRVRQGLFYITANKFPIGSIEAMERAHGLPPPYSLAPKLYYQPRPFKFDLSNTVLCDFGSVSSKIGERGLREAMTMMHARFTTEGIGGPKFLQIVHRSGVAIHAPAVAGEAYQVSSIYEYVDMIAACRAWVGSESGGQALAAAVRGEHDVYELDARPEVVVTATPPTFNSRGYTFRGVDYRVTCSGDVSRDYWDPTEVGDFNYDVQCEVREVEMARQAGG